MSKEERETFFNGKKDADGKSFNRGVVALLGTRSAEAITAAVERLRGISAIKAL
jgi:hypothetical protein